MLKSEITPTPLFLGTIGAIIAAPLIWNIVARQARRFTRGKSEKFRYAVCYAMTIWIFGFSSFRDYLFHLSITTDQMQHHPALSHPALPIVAALLVIVGQTFVLSSFYKLGITGTFLGDYCGILMDAPVTTFPFNVLDNPMYVGSTMCFLGSSLWYGSPAGIALTCVVFVVYQVAQQFEGPYTSMIYAERAAGKKVH